MVSSRATFLTALLWARRQVQIEALGCFYKSRALFLDRSLESPSLSPLRAVAAILKPSWGDSCPTCCKIHTGFEEQFTEDYSLFSLSARSRYLRCSSYCHNQGESPVEFAFRKKPRKLTASFFSSSLHYCFPSALTSHFENNRRRRAVSHNAALKRCSETSSRPSFPSPRSTPSSSRILPSVTSSRLGKSLLFLYRAFLRMDYR